MIGSLLFGKVRLMVVQHTVNNVNITLKPCRLAAMFVLIYLSIDIYAGQQMEIIFKDWQFVNLKFATLFITNSL